jgi:hypothetical protein
VIPEPSMSVTLADDEVEGALSPVPLRGDNVTFVPSAFAYIMNMLAPVIELPWPSPIHDIDVGPVI